MFDPTQFAKTTYGSQCIYFDKEVSFQKYWDHKKLKTKRFPYHKNLLNFLKDNPEVKIYFTINEEISPFIKVGGGFLIDFKRYSEFCKSIASSTKGRTQAFLGQHLEVMSTEQKAQFIKENATEQSIINALEGFSQEAKVRITESLSRAQTTAQPANPRAMPISQDQFLEVFSKFLTDPLLQTKVFNNLPKIQIDTLKSHLIFLKQNLGQNETFIQNWIDENDGKYRKQRCLIFGLEYVDPKREGVLNSKRFDILAEQNREHHVLIELKSPNAEVFKIESEENKNGGYSSTYNISPDLSRAIPQILSYKDWYENQASPEDLQKLGIEKRKLISKCIIVIGQTVENDEVWKGNFKRLKESLNDIEICTYTDLINRLENTIRNLEENL